MRKKKAEVYAVTAAKRTLQSWKDHARHDAYVESLLWDNMVKAVRILRGEKQNAEG